jgi:serine protease inhibitor
MYMKMLILLFGMILCLYGCKTEDETIIDEIEVSEKTARLIEAENEFGLELFKHVFTSETEYENIMVSPLSVSLALAMTYNGAKGETKTAMENTLKVYGLETNEINASYRDLVRALKSLDPKVLMEIANAIFYRKDFTVEPDFVTINRNYYDAQVTPLDFNNQTLALKTINDWVSVKTHKKIDRIISEIKPTHVMFLLNAIYFKGIWKSQFNESETRKQSFNLENGTVIQADMMQLTDTVAYTSNDLFSAIRLPYGKGNYNMYIFLPNQGKTLTDMTSSLNMNEWKLWMKAFGPAQKTDIKIPRFKYKYEIKLNDVLTTMGMGVAFTGLADFSGMNKDGGLNIDYVKHKTFIEVNEEGTEAAAVTVVAIERTSVGPEKQQFIANRPFMYAITEEKTGAILFMGTLKDPLQLQE